MQMQWNILQPDPTTVRKISEHLNCNPVIAAVLANRNINSALQADHFIHPTWDILPSPMKLHGMEAATDRIYYAIKNKEKILIFGDYDADGVTSTALISQFLRSCGADVSIHLPHRIEEGYGLQAKHINQLAAPNDIKVIITVDCGSSGHAAVEAATRFGIDVIVTDHHNYETLPPALSVINPKIPDQPARLTGLAGVGVAFYLSIGLRMTLREKGWWDRSKEPKLIDLCDMVALGTIADMAPLAGANRILTKAGLKKINHSPRPGIAALCHTCNLNPGIISSEDIAYRLAPRINAAGRISHSRIAYDLLNAQTSERAKKLADTLGNLNQRRREIESKIFDTVVRRIESRDDLMQRKTILLSDENWHQGVLGIVAAKLTARYHRPVILLAIENGIGKGSGRSIPELNIFEALSRCEALLEQFGGHQMAAGLSIHTDKIRQLRVSFEDAVSQMTASCESSPTITIDSEIEFDQITPKLMDELSSLEPFGIENPPPVFTASKVNVASAAVVGKNHRRMSLWQSSNKSAPIDAIQFNLKPDTPRAERFERLAFRLQWNQYRGKKKIQIIVEDF